MSNPLSPGKAMAEAALITATAASCVVPAGTLLCSELYKAQGDPGQQYDAAMAWFALGDTLQQAIQDAERINNSVGGVWRDDEAETAFTAKAADYIRQLMVAMAFAYATGIGLIVSAITMFVAITVGLVLAGVLAAFAAAFLAAVASVVGNLGPSEAIMADATTYALDAYNSFRALMKGVEACDMAVAGEIGVFLGADVGVQFALGDHDALGDLAQATVDGIGDVASGLVAKLWQEVVAAGMKVPGVGNPIRTIAQGAGVADTVTGTTPLDGVEDWLQKH